MFKQLFWNVSGLGVMLLGIFLIVVWVRWRTGHIVLHEQISRTNIVSQPSAVS